MTANSSLFPLTALDALVTACEDAYVGVEMSEFSDDEDVTSPPCGITFGMIRRARAELEEALDDC